MSPVIGSSAVGGDGFTTETLTDAELGLKFQGKVARFNLAVYVDQIKDAQHAAFTFVRGNPAVITVNVPRARVEGIEWDGELKPVSWLSIGASVNYTDAHFTQALVLAEGVPTVFGPYPDTPRSSGSCFGAIVLPVRSALHLKLRGNFYSQKSSVFTSTQSNNTGAKLPGYSVASFDVGMEDSRSGWSLTLHLKNAFNKVYYVGGVAPGEVLQFNTAIPGAPRTMSVAGNYHF